MNTAARAGFMAGVCIGVAVAGLVETRRRRYVVAKAVRDIATGHPPPLSLDVAVRVERPDLLLSLFNLFGWDDLPMVLAPEREGDPNRVVAGKAAEQEAERVLSKRRGVRPGGQ